MPVGTDDGRGPDVTLSPYVHVITALGKGEQNPETHWVSLTQTQKFLTRRDLSCRGLLLQKTEELRVCPGVWVDRPKPAGRAAQPH